MLAQVGNAQKSLKTLAKYLTEAVKAEQSPSFLKHLTN